MLVARILLAAGLLAGSVAAKLAKVGHGSRKPTAGHKPMQVGRPQLDFEQYIRSTADLSAMPFKAGQYTFLQQGHALCASHGEKQWTGTVDVTDDRRLFYWFFESRGDPDKDPVIVWLNGGPGSSSMYGVFTEMGPCWLESGRNETTPNDWSWNNKASVLFLDQPAGTGFSTVSSEEFLPREDIDGAEDFQVFLNVFFSQLFPSKAHLPIHIAGESYGGHYLPTYTKHILDSRRYEAKGAFRGNITSLILVNALVDIPAIDLGAYELLCLSENGKGILNQTACDFMRENYPECWKLRQECVTRDDPWACVSALDYCGETEWYYEGDPYYIHRQCTNKDCDGPQDGNITAYLNQPHTLSALSLSPDFAFSATSEKILNRYLASGSFGRPTLGEVGDVLDAYREPGRVGDVKVLVMNGNDDWICNTPGNKIAYDEVRWSGQADYRNRPWRPMPTEIAATGEWKGTADGRLVFVTVDGAGHELPQWVREGSFQILERWIAGEWRA